MESLIEEEKIDKSSIVKKTLVFFIILILGFMLYSSKTNMISFFKKSTNEVEALDIMNYSKIPDSVSQIVFLNLKVSKSYVGNITLLSNSIVLYNDSVSLLKQNTLELIGWSSNKSSMLSSHIKALHKKIDSLSDIIEEIRMFSQEEMLMKEEHFSQKTLWDNMFFNWLNQNDMELLSDGLELSYNNSSEYIKHRVLYSASDKIRQKLVLIKWILESKATLLENNEDTLVNHYDLINEGDLAERIVFLKQKFRNYEFTSEEE